MTSLIHWADWAAFVEMGGYGRYVWGAFGMAAAGLAAECLALRMRRQALRTAADRPAANDFEVVAHEA